MVSEKEAYENLANAIILSAVEDYKVALRKLLIDPYDPITEREVKELEEFFFGSWYEILTDVNPQYLTKKIKEMILEEVKYAH